MFSEETESIIARNIADEIVEIFESRDMFLTLEEDDQLFTLAENVVRHHNQNSNQQKVTQ